jgi:hypothetical protein
VEEVLSQGERNESSFRYPCLGLDANGVYIATLLFDYYGGGAAITRKLVAIPKAALLAGTDVLEQPAADANVFTLPFTEGGHIIQPAHSFESNPPGNIAWMLTKADPPTPRPRYRPGAILYGKLRWSAGTGLFEKQPAWFDPRRGLEVPSDLSYWDVPPNRIPFEAPQKLRYGLTGGVPVGHTSTHIMSAVLRNNSLWTCQHVGFNADGSYSGSGAPPDRSGIVWFRFRVQAVQPNPALAHTAPPSFGRIWDGGPSPKMVLLSHPCRERPRRTGCWFLAVPAGTNLLVLTFKAGPVALSKAPNSSRLAATTSPSVVPVAGPITPLPLSIHWIPGLSAPSSRTLTWNPAALLN